MPRTLLSFLLRRSHAAGKPRRARLNLVGLEDRAVPAITAAYDAPTKTLTVTGDAVINEISVELVGTTVSVFQDFVTGVKTPVTVTNAPARFTVAALGRVVVNADAGNDVVSVDAKISKPAELNGGADHDNLSGGSGSDTINGGDGDDLLRGGKGNDIISGGDGVDAIEGNDGNDNLSGGAGQDALIGGAGNDVLDGGDDADTLFGDDSNPKSKGNDTVTGGAGDDTELGGAGNDNLNGGIGNDWLEAGIGNDVALGGPDTVNSLAGETDVDQIFGDAGNDTLSGGAENDAIFGEAGSDSLVGGAGQDTESGGLGRDFFVGHGTTAPGTGSPTDEQNFDTYRDEFNLSKPIFKKAEPKDIAEIELEIDDTLAALAAIAAVPADYNLASRIRYLGAGEFLVKLGDPEGFNWVPVSFDGTWTDNDARPSAGERFSPAKSTAEQPEFWTVLFARARLAVQTLNTFDPFAWIDQTTFDALTPNIANPGEAVFDLTDRAPTAFAVPGGITFADVQAKLADQQWLTVKAAASPAPGLTGGQAYAIVKAFTNASGSFITLYNPGGFDKGQSALGAMDAFGRPKDDGFITLSATEFFNATNFATVYAN
ncbi:MAG TPA: calcium-binding protein [Gemmataceae bacterium]|nr:calcium-binding protein [Gemmataceae bacterium]